MPHDEGFLGRFETLFNQKLGRALQDAVGNELERLHNSKNPDDEALFRALTWMYAKEEGRALRDGFELLLTISGFASEWLFDIVHAHTLIKETGEVFFSSVPNEISAYFQYNKEKALKKLPADYTGPTLQELRPLAKRFSGTLGPIFKGVLDKVPNPVKQSPWSSKYTKFMRNVAATGTAGTKDFLAFWEKLNNDQRRRFRSVLEILDEPFEIQKFEQLEFVDQVRYFELAYVLKKRDSREWRVRWKLALRAFYRSLSKFNDAHAGFNDRLRQATEGDLNRVRDDFYSVKNLKRFPRRRAGLDRDHPNIQAVRSHFRRRFILRAAAAAIVVAAAVRWYLIS